MPAEIVKSVKFYPQEVEFLERQDQPLSALVLQALREKYPDFPHQPRQTGGAPKGNTNRWGHRRNHPQ